MGRKIIYCFTLLLLCGWVSSVYAGKLIEQPAQGYCIVLPDSKLLDKSLPILVCLPGWGITTKQDINMWAFPVSKRGFLALGIDVDYSSIKSLQDVKALHQRIKNIINSLIASYNINGNKIYIAGTSAGGIMSVSLALLYPGEFQAVGVVSGSRLGFGAENLLKNARGQLLYLFHGEKDKSIPIEEFYATKNTLQANGAIVKFKIIPEGQHTLATSYYKELVDWFYQLSELIP